jgi:hypothetical protein
VISIPENVKDRRKNDRPAQQDAGCLRQNRLTDESEPVEKYCPGEYQRTRHDVAYSLGKMRVSFFKHAVSQDRAFTVTSVPDDVANIIDFHQIGPSFFHQVASGRDNDPIIQLQTTEFIAFAYQLI